MNPPELQLYVGNKLEYHGPLTVPTMLGRESDDDRGPLFAPQPRDGVVRIAIAKKQLTDMSRQLLLVTPSDNRTVRVENLGKQLVHVTNGEPLAPSQQRELPLPVELTVLDRRIKILQSKQVETVLLSMEAPILPPGSAPESFSAELSSNFLLAQKLDAQERDQLIRWLGGVTAVLQSALGSADFYERAAREMVELIGLDSGRILELTGEENWTVIAAYDRQTVPELRRQWVPVADLLRRVTAEKKTCWTTPLDLAAETSSRVGLMAAIAAPLLDQSGNVIGMLYGDRRRRGTTAVELIGTLEAMLVETLARGVAAGRARVEHQKVAAELQVRFEQFFTPELSRQLAENPDLLTRRDTEVSILFCDIRRFSAISEARGAEVTMEWLSDVMGNMADCAAFYQGSLIDYIGDELMIMWGAPAIQPDHATRACQAALKMASLSVELDSSWRARLGHPTQFGIGVNTGIARVGNVGFNRKFRYAPFGNTVNLASRVQGATKYLGAGVVVTEPTFQQQQTKALSRRLCSVRVVNIEQPVDLYELCYQDDPETTELCQQYQAALACYEKEELPRAVRILSEILRLRPNDGPTLLLLSRAVDALLHREAEFNPVFDLPGK